ncbi:hypothetical protein CRENBAI_009367 [Crenichthys baileyi]|uniref:Uncharacterized protein n=1 Tax=Crenichthys baileyi TaxID=28760 RepID=A0AAV9R130_9TELE
MVDKLFRLSSGPTQSKRHLRINAYVEDIWVKNGVNMVKRCIAGGGSNTTTAAVSLHFFPEARWIRAAWIRAGKLMGQMGCSHQGQLVVIGGLFDKLLRTRNL